MAVSDRTGSILEDPDRLAALAVAVASSEEPLATLETLCQSVLDGVDVGTALEALLDNGKKKGSSKGCVGEHSRAERGERGRRDTFRLTVFAVSVYSSSFSFRGPIFSLL